MKRSKTGPSLAAIGEQAAIRRIVRRLPARADIAVGAGDDCAVVRPAARAEREDWLLKSDPVIEGIHFAAGTPAAAVGHKAVGRVLSDLAAMGGTPRWGLLDLVAPPALPARELDALYRGALRLAQRHGLAIAGGDLARGRQLEIHAFAVGTVPRGAAVLRSGARTGDAVFVTGTLGGSLRRKHLRFEPRVLEGQWLRDWATSMIDVSDGLATDLRHLMESGGVGAMLTEQAIPVAADARRMPDRRSPLDHALRDGEDFELLFTVPAHRVQAFLRDWETAFRLRCTLIGRITEFSGRLEIADAAGRARVLTGGGYEHFR